jgi:hypothetical protein
MLLLNEFETEKDHIKKTPRPYEKIFYSKKGGKARTQKIEFKQVVIKNISTVNYAGTKSVLEYIEKGADDIGLQNEKGEIKTVDEIFEEWKQDFTQKEYIKDKPTKRVPKEAIHLIFSIDEKINFKNLEALKKSVEDTLKFNFSQYKYAYVLHTHQNKPHVHVLINKRNIYTRKKLHFKTKIECRDFYNKLREDFKDGLNYYNKNFKYQNKYRIDRNLELLMLKDTIKRIGNQKYIFKIMEQDVKKTFEVANMKKTELEQKLDETKNQLKKTTPIFSLLNKDLQEQKKVIEKLYSYTSKKGFFEKIIKNNNTIFEKMNMIKKVDLGDLEKAISLIEYFENPFENKLLTKSQKKMLRSVKIDLEQSKFIFKLELEEQIKREKIDLEKIAEKNTVYKILPLLQKVEQRLKASELLEDLDLQNTLEKNKKFLLSLLEQRVLKNKSLFNFLLKKLKDEKDNEEIKKIRDYLTFLKNEKEILDKNFKDVVEASKKLEIKNEAIAISKKLEIDIEPTQTFEDFILEHRTEYILKLQKDITRYAETISETINIKIGNLDPKDFIEKYADRYKHIKAKDKAIKIAKKLKLDIDFTKISTKGLHEFIQEHKKEYDELVNTNVNNFIIKIAKELGFKENDLSTLLSSKTLKLKFDWIEKNNERSQARKNIELLAKVKIKEYEKALSVATSTKNEKEISYYEMQLNNANRLLKKSDGVAPIFPGDLEVIGIDPKKYYENDEKTIPTEITYLGIKCDNEQFKDLKNSIDSLATKQKSKVEKYFKFLESMEEKIISKSYLAKHGFLQLEKYKNLEFEQIEATTPMLNMQKITQDIQNLVEQNIDKINELESVKKDMQKNEKMIQQKLAEKTISISKNTEEYENSFTL